MFIKNFKNFKIFVLNSSNCSNVAIENHFKKYFYVLQPFFKHQMDRGFMEDINTSTKARINAIKDNVCLLATAPNGDVAAISISHFAYKNIPIFDKNLYKHPLTLAMIEMYAEATDECDLFNKFKVDRMFHSNSIGVATQYIGNGLAKMLTHESEELAKKNGCKVMFGHCISPFSRKIMDALNWEVGKVVDYNERFGKMGKEFFDWAPGYGKYDFRYKVLN